MESTYGRYPSFSRGRLHMHLHGTIMPTNRPNKVSWVCLRTMCQGGKKDRGRAKEKKFNHAWRLDLRRTPLLKEYERVDTILSNWIQSNPWSPFSTSLSTYALYRLRARELRPASSLAVVVVVTAATGAGAVAWERGGGKGGNGGGGGGIRNSSIVARMVSTMAFAIGGGMASRICPSWRSVGPRKMKSSEKPWMRASSRTVRRSPRSAVSGRFC